MQAVKAVKVVKAVKAVKAAFASEAYDVLASVAQSEGRSSLVCARWPRPPIPDLTSKSPDPEPPEALKQKESPAAPFLRISSALSVAPQAVKKFSNFWPGP